MWKKFKLKWHNFFLLHDYIYSNPCKLPPCIRKCSKCGLEEVMVGNNAGLFWLNKHTKG